jgi:hypothetical protein
MQKSSPENKFNLRSIARVFHPFLFALYSGITLLATNIFQVEVSEGYRILLISIVVSVLILFLTTILLRDVEKAGFITSIIIMIVFSYGHVYSSLKGSGILGANLVRHRYLLPFILILTVGLFGFALKKKEFRQTTAFLNVIAIGLIALPLIQIINYQFRSYQNRLEVDPTDSECQLQIQDGQTPPDIYLVILDAYTRADILDELHGYDNSPFLDELTQMGFFIADGSLSNYRHTEMSLGSLHSFDYLQNVFDNPTPENYDRLDVIDLILDSRARSELECIGYLSVAIDPGIFWTRWEDADILVSSTSDVFQSFQIFKGISRFEALWINSTLAKAIVDGNISLDARDNPVLTDPNDDLRNKILFSFDQLGEVANLPGPKFVFAHILSPHPPMLFGPNGEKVSSGSFELSGAGSDGEQEILDAYSDQVTYVNTRILESIRNILNSSSVPPVIIVMGDHGWADRNAEDKLSILNAYHLPDANQMSLYKTITPVNTFRIIFNEYFGTEFEYLEDISYFSRDDETLYEFEIVPNTWAEN